MTDDTEFAQVWDAALAKNLVGKILLAGITFLDADKTLIEQQQFFGEVVSVDPQAGVLIALHGSRAGEQYTLPPDTRSIREASPGEYRLRVTGEVVEDPDYLVTYTVHKPALQ
jgi:hypothetical protein